MTVVIGFDGGLGNQMFQYAAGRALALRSGAGILFDTSPYRPGSTRTFELDAFAITGNRLSLMDRHRFGLDRYRLGTAHRGQPPPTGIALAAERDRKGLNPVPDTVQRDTFLHGYWQHEAHFASHAALIRQEFRLPEQPPGLAEAIAEIAAAESVAVHVRRTDYLAPGNAAYNVCGPSYYARAMALLAERIEQPRFYVFSDDIGAAAAVVKPPGPHQFVPGDGRPPVHDLMLMAACRHFVIANSTFSWWGAWLGRHPGKLVVAPDPWIRGRPELRTAPAEWLLLPAEAGPGG